jgi:prolyl-tRNA editing enzyme YbaK/EbsC (Cys-tRNA(Pro) deacylase)
MEKWAYGKERTAPFSIDPKVLEADRIICGSGLQKSKISLPSKFLLKLENGEVLENLAKE